jgi:hypothetical protein
MTEIHPKYIAPCGLYCGVCRIRYATEKNDLEYLRRLAHIYARRFPEISSADPEELLCDGCLSARRFVFCRECAIRDCAQQKGYQGCHECLDFPCDLIAKFPMPVGKKVILRSIPFWRKYGTEQWVNSEEERYQCPECGHRLFRGARQCEGCKSTVNVD